jgi:hypothetical protein
MTKDEFISIYNKARKRGTTIAVFYLVSGSCCMFAVILVAIFMEKNRAHEWAVLIATAYILFCIVIFPFILWLNKHTIKKYSLFCPHCKQPLVKMYFEIAKATGHCGNCRQKVFED